MRLALDFVPLPRPRTSRAKVVAALSHMAEQSGVADAERGSRVADLALLMARGIGMGSVRRAALAEAAHLLDLGMAGLPPYVVHHSQTLNDEEEATFQLHPLRSLEIVRDLDLHYEQLNGIMHHHERIDGRGYPMGLAGHEIPEFARILAIAVAYDDMTHPGAVGTPAAADDAVAEVRAGAGTRFDPLLVEAFAAAVGGSNRAT